MRSISVEDLIKFRDEHKWRPLQHHQEIVEFLNISLQNLPSSESIVFIEIGILKGGNFVFIGDILKKFYKNVYGIGIDLPGIKKFAGEKVNPIKEVKALNPTFDWDLVIGNSRDLATIQKVSDLLAGRTPSILFIDGDHSYDGCMSDFKNYSPMVKDKGIIGFHDLGENRFDVRTKVWPEMKKRYPKHWELVRQPGHYGIGVILKGK